MAQPTISVIVPVFNVERYLEQCIDSILSQTFTEFELILIDDGSTDMSPTICDNYAKKDARICVIHKENSGQADARNIGIDIARGQYLSFVDSDDVISSEYLNQLYDTIQENDADISVCDELSFQDGESFLFSDVAFASCGCMSGREACIRHYNMEWIISVGPCAKLFKIDLFKRIRFPVGKIYEDQGTVPRLWYTAEKVAVLKGCSLYAYRIRTDSTTHSNFSKRKFEDVWNVDLCHDFFAENSDKEMEMLCMRFRKILLAKYIVLAHHNDAADQIPDEYQMSLYKALSLLRREVKDHTYTWYLSLVYPQWVKLHSYIRKAEELLRIAKTER